MEATCDAKTSVKNQYIAAIVMNIIVFCHGCAIGWVSPSLPALSGASTPLDEPLTVSQTAFVASLICVGAMSSTPLFGWIADRYGRKSAAIASAFPYLACWLIKMFWRTATGLMIARFLGGVGGAGLFMLAPLYASEVGCIDTRGALSSFLVFSVNIGIVFMFTLGAYASYTTVLAVMIPVPIVFVLLMLRMPETPAFLVKKNRLDEAAKSLSWLRGVPADSGIVRKEIDHLKYEVKMASKPTVNSNFILNDSSVDNSALAMTGLENVPTWKIFIGSAPTLRAFSVCFMLLTVQCFMGMFAVITYSTDIFSAAGSTLSPSVSSIVVGLLQLIGSIIASSLIERLGRKALLISSCLTVGISMASMGTFFILRDSGFDVSSLGWIPITSLSVAVCTFAMGAGPVPYVLPSEIFMVQTRGLATSILLTWVWIASFIIAQFFNSAVIAFGIGTVFWFFACVCVFGIIVTVFFLPETKGRTMDEVLAGFGGKSRTVPGKGPKIGELL